MKFKLLTLLTLVILGCNKQSTISPVETKLPEVEIIPEPGTRTSKGGLILNQDLLLDKNMNFAYLRIRDFDNELSATQDRGWSYVHEIISSRVSEIVYKSFKDDFDFIAALVSPGGAWPPFFIGTDCPSEGIGCEYSDIKPYRLKGYIVEPGDKGFGGYVAIHEIAHYWGNHGVVPTTDKYHWGYSNVGGFLGGFDEMTYLGNKTYQGSFVQGNILSNPYSTYKYGNLELYLMGLIPASELKPIIVAKNPKSLYNNGELWGQFTADTLTTIRPNEFITKWGERLPSFENSQKTFKMLIVIVSSENVVKAEMSDEESRDLGWYIEEFSERGSIEDIENYEKLNFWKATGGRATIDTKISEDNIKISIQ